MRSKRRLIITIVSIVAALALIAGFIWVVAHPYSSTSLSDTSASSTSTNSSNNSNSNGSASNNSNNQPATSTPTQPSTPQPDPSTVKSLTISQLGLTINYDKTLPGLSYEIKRTGSGTQYISLTYDGLIGDKCTGDQGEFASILKDPTSADSVAIKNTIKLGSDTYGLALPDSSCTNNVDLFNQYQDSMKANFPYMTLVATNP